MKDRLVLTAEESFAFTRNMIHPDIKALMNRDAFLQGIEGLTINFANGKIIAEYIEQERTMCTYYRWNNKEPCCTHDCSGCVWFEPEEAEEAEEEVQE